MRLGGVLVVRALHHVLDAEFAGALAHRLRVATADQRRLETGELQQLDAVPVEGVERLQLLAARAVPQASVG